MTEAPSPPPNHHAHHPGFSGPAGYLAAVRFLVGRGRATEIACELADLRPGDRVVDIGCGPGAAVATACRLGATAVGVDPSTAMLRVARWRWWRLPTTTWRSGTAESLPVEDGWATVVWSLKTVHHWRDVDAGLDEVARVLTTGGRVVALERRVADPLAEGVAGHGWTLEQAEDFAAACRDHGFTDARVGLHEGEPTFVSVTARA